MRQAFIPVGALETVLDRSVEIRAGETTVLDVP